MNLCELICIYVNFYALRLGIHGMKFMIFAYLASQRMMKQHRSGIIRFIALQISVKLGHYSACVHIRCVELMH